MELIQNRCPNCKDAFEGKRLLREKDVVIVDSNDNVVAVLYDNVNLEGGKLYESDEYNTYEEIKYCDTNWWYE